MFQKIVACSLTEAISSWVQGINNMRETGSLLRHLGVSKRSLVGKIFFFLLWDEIIYAARKQIERGSEIVFFLFL